MATPDRPNILFILTDDQGAWALGCAGTPELRTPHLDRLAAEGTRFTHAFCASPVCSPARASLLTGRIPSQHGVHDWLRAGNSVIEEPKGGRLTRYLDGLSGYTDLLADAGWACGLSGKWHLGDAHHPQKGFTWWNVHAKGGGPYYGAPMVRGPEVYDEPRYVTDVIIDHALEYLEAHDPAAGPFYLGVHTTAPHSPWNRDNHPAETWDAYRRDCPFASVPDVPLHPWQVASAPCGTDPERRRDVLAGYFAAVTEMDRNVGRLLDWLDAQRLREETLVLFTSDNGMNMGHHGVYGKGNGTFPLNMYDTSVKVPLLASHPGRVPAGRVCQAMVSHYDVRPTLLEYVGVADPEADALPGASFAGVLAGGAPPDDADVVVHDEYGPVRMVRTRSWKYVHRYPYGPHELYNLEADPDETANLVDDAPHEPTRRDLKARLDRWADRWVDPRRDGAREPVTGAGQTGLCGPAADGETNFWPRPRPVIAEGGQA